MPNSETVSRAYNPATESTVAQEHQQLTNSETGKEEEYGPTVKREGKRTRLGPGADINNINPQPLTHGSGNYNINPQPLTHGSREASLRIIPPSLPGRNRASLRLIISHMLHT